MRPLRVALLQMRAHGLDRDANLATGLECCRRAADMGADVALFPEMWSAAYRLPDPDDAGAVAAWAAQAVGPDSPFVTAHRELATELDMAIACTYLEQWAGAPRNTVSLIDRRGEIALTYAKVHTCDFAGERACTPGDGFRTAALDTAAGPVRVGAMICYDREFPESARVLMLQGAELILVPNACTMSPLRLGQLEVRAFENMVAVALANYPAPQENGHSVAYHPVAYDAPDIGRENDLCVVEADEGEGVWIAEFDLEAIRAYRARESWGDAYRKPRAYTGLTESEPREPFVRRDARR